MLYDAYVVKMKKLVKIRNWIIKYKFLLLAIAVIILAGTISFLASIGSISIVNDCKEEIQTINNILTKCLNLNNLSCQKIKS